MNLETHSALRETLVKLSEFSQRVVQDVQQNPVLGSIASKEFDAASPYERVALKTALSQARLYLLASDDSLRGLQRTFQEPVLAVTPWLCTRAVLESAGLSCWLSRSTIDASERISRSVGIRFDSIQNELRARGKGNMGKNDSADDGPFTNVLAAASNLGIKPKRIYNKHLSQVGAQKPKFSSVVASELSMRDTYGHLSNMVHANPLTLLGRLFETSEVSKDDPDLRQGMSEIRDEDILQLSLLAARGYVTGTKELLLLLGYFAAPVAEQMETYTKRLEALLRTHLQT